MTLNKLAWMYNNQARYADALPIIKRTLSQGTADKIVAFPALFAAQGQSLISTGQALADSYEIVQRASASAAAGAVSKLAARFAAGSGELAQFVRKDQDLAAETEALDKTVIAFVSKPPAQRSAAAEEQVRMRIAEVKAEREKLQQIFKERFPNYVGLSRPQPVSVQETQALLAGDEALLVFDFGVKSYAWIITGHDADWTELKISAKELDAQVQALRAWLTEIASKQRLSIVANGALTGLSPQLLITKDPGAGLAHSLPCHNRPAIRYQPQNPARRVADLLLRTQADDRLCRSCILESRTRERAAARHAQHYKFLPRRAGRSRRRRGISSAVAGDPEGSAANRRRAQGGAGRYQARLGRNRSGGEASQARSISHRLFCNPWACCRRPGIVCRGKGRAGLGTLDPGEAR
jgi:hypothetical protein